MVAVRDTLAFMGQCAMRFRETGAVIPSGGNLARAMVAAVGSLRDGQVMIELGPGTGVFTRELAKRFPRNPLVAIEFNHVFAGRLRDGMPQVQVVEGCASRLAGHLHDLDIDVANVGAVLSGLPLLSLPRGLSAAIFSSISEILAPGRPYIQFTYSRRAWRTFDLPGLRLESNRVVWLNLPPASVMTFRRTGAAAPIPCGH
jgi:phosphatidylethanolamine/phosphatidyl-N-methylethanolamine N-methyltransferase